MIQPPGMQEAAPLPVSQSAALAAPGVSRPVTAIEQADATKSPRGYRRETGSETNRGRNEGLSSRAGANSSNASVNSQRLSRAVGRLGQLIDVYA